MTRSEQRQEDGIGRDLVRAYAAILNEARAEVVANREPSLAEFEERVREATRRQFAVASVAKRGAIERAEARALGQLVAVATVFRARTLLTRGSEAVRTQTRPSPTTASTPARPSRHLLRVKPTISANMDVRRGGDGERFTLEWDPIAAVVEWEVRFNERPDPRGSYLMLETLSLPSDQTTIDVPIGEHLFRVNIVGHSRDGRPVRRAVISSLTRETWNDRWERRASAA